MTETEERIAEERILQFSDDRMYRYCFSHIWDRELPVVAFIMCNPSRADETRDDPTIRRVRNYAKRWGYGGMHVCNLCAFRSVRPTELRSAADPEGPENRQWVADICARSALVVYAWGNKMTEPDWLRALVPHPCVLGLNENNVPRHPLYARNDLVPRDYIRVA